MLFITSDLHLDHQRVIDFNQRPFEGLEEMQEKLFAEINSLPDGATLYSLGDFVIKRKKDHLRALLNRIKKSIRLIFVLGNHDDAAADVFREFGEVHLLLHVRYNKRTLVMCHYPLMEWRRGQDGAIHFFGHCHGRLNVQGKALDVGWDAHKRILPMEEAVAMADAKPIFQPCHDSRNGLV